MRERESGRESWRGRDGEKKVGDRKRESGLEREGERAIEKKCGRERE